MIPSHSYSLDGLADIAAVFVYLKAECSLASASESSHVGDSVI